MVAADQQRLSLRQPVGRVACALLVSVQLRRGERKIGPDERPPHSAPGGDGPERLRSPGIDANDAEQMLVDVAHRLRVIAPERMTCQLRVALRVGTAGWRGGALVAVAVLATFAIPVLSDARTGTFTCEIDSQAPVEKASAAMYEITCASSRRTDVFW